jgi:glycosyltransferase involved in cell wall biosynthesis
MELVFYKEFFTQIATKPKLLQQFLASLSSYARYRRALSDYLKENEDEELTFYTYWYEEVTYALQSLKREFDFTLVTRTHGYDLYEDRRKNNYMPLRRQFLENIDKIYIVSSSAKEYLCVTYGFCKEKIFLARLGVNDKNIVSKCNESYVYHIVSCSNLVQVKQLDKLIDAIAQINTKNDRLKIRWTHIGEGELGGYLRSHAKKMLGNSNNLTYCFLGEMKNKDVYDFYNKNKVDVFINVSSSEGAPVSIMEAMSCAIPIIAPDIGGISDLVIDGFNGVLLSEKPTICEIRNALLEINHFKLDQTRTNSYNLYNEKCNAKKNYGLFIKDILGSTAA